jgi:uncharacterized protein (TIGR03118 family)
VLSDHVNLQQMRHAGRWLERSRKSNSDVTFTALRAARIATTPRIVKPANRPTALSFIRISHPRRKHVSVRANLMTSSQRLFKWLKLSAAVGLATFAVPNVMLAQHYTQENLISDIPGMAANTDPNLKNPWGLTRSPSGSPWWIANNNSGTSTLEDGNGNPINIFVEANSSVSNFVVVPPPGFAAAGTPSTPTGIVFNGSPTDFLLKIKGKPVGKAAIFIFATEDGTISGWNPTVNLLPGGNPPSPNAVLEVDNSDKGSANSAVYKGMTSGEIEGKKFLYVTNFRAGTVEVYDTNFQRVGFNEDNHGNSHRDGGALFSEDAFNDDDIPDGFAPFNIQNIGGSLFVTYAKQDAARHDPVGGDGLGFVDIFSTTGELEGRLEHGNWFNAPWGVVWTPRDFGEFSNTILVGNFRSGWIAAFNGFSKKFIGFVLKPDNSLVFIDGLWSLTFGNNGTAGPSTTLFFSAGPNNETDGLFGTLKPVATEQDGDEE